MDRQIARVFRFVPRESADEPIRYASRSPPQDEVPGRRRVGRECRPDARLSLLLGGTAVAAGKPEYNRDIRPILAENCFACHGPDSAARKADLRLDRREAAVEAGAITPGDLDASELIARINTTNTKEVMPPPSLHKTLTGDAERRLAAVDRGGSRISTALVAHPTSCDRHLPG